MTNWAPPREMFPEIFPTLDPARTKFWPALVTAFVFVTFSVPLRDERTVGCPTKVIGPP